MKHPSQRLPKLYAPAKIKFSSLRNGVGQNMGVIFDIDTMVERTCRRVLIRGGWKWQIVNYDDLVKWDSSAEADKEILDEYVSELEFEYAR